MMAPYFVDGLFGDQTSYVIEFFIGVAFGVILERAGFGRSTKLAAQFYFTDFTVFKVMFSAILTAMMLVFLSTGFGLLNFDWVYVNPTYLWSQMVGGLIMGVGFVIGGFCPGTSIVSASTGRIDGVFFLVGTLFAMFFWGETVDLWGSFYTEAGFLGRLTLDQVTGLSVGTTIFLIVVIALGLFYGAEIVEAKMNKKGQENVA
jgi:uncharacterized membrane protein YedE/YeeE